MTHLGDCLVFYLKYPVEMMKLGQGDELEGLEDPEGTRKMADQVIVKGCAEGAEFLEECGRRIVAHFSKIGNSNINKYSPIETPAKIEKKWSLSYVIWPADKNRPAAGKERMTAGVDLKETQVGKFELIPWLWCNGENAEDSLAFILKDVIQQKTTSKDIPGWESGRLALARLPVSVTLDTSQFSCDHLLAGLDKALSGITKAHFDTCYP